MDTELKDAPARARPAKAPACARWKSLFAAAPVLSAEAVPEEPAADQTSPPALPPGRGDARPVAK